MTTGRKAVSRLPDGPGGPESLKPDSSSRRVAKAAAIHKVCGDLIAQGLRPTFARVRDARVGFGEATLNRAYHRPIVHAAQIRYEAVAAGSWDEADAPDLFARMLEMIEGGRWDPDGLVDPPRLRDGSDGSDGGGEAGGDPGDGQRVGDHDAAPGGGIAGEHGGGPAGGGPDGGAPADKRVEALERKLATALALVERRDQQILRAVRVARERGRTIGRMRIDIADLRAENATLAAEPLPLREIRDWDDD